MNPMLTLIITQTEVKINSYMRENRILCQKNKIKKSNIRACWRGDTMINWKIKIATAKAGKENIYAIYTDKSFLCAGNSSNGRNVLSHHHELIQHLLRNLPYHADRDSGVHPDSDIVKIYLIGSCHRNHLEADKEHDGIHQKNNRNDKGRYRAQSPLLKHKRRISEQKTPPYQTEKENRKA